MMEALVAVLSVGTLLSRYLSRLKAKQRSCYLNDILLRTCIIFQNDFKISIVSMQKKPEI